MSALLNNCVTCNNAFSILIVVLGESTYKLGLLVLHSGSHAVRLMDISSVPAHCTYFIATITTYTYINPLLDYTLHKPVHILHTLFTHVLTPHMHPHSLHTCTLSPHTHSTHAPSPHTLTPHMHPLPTHSLHTCTLLPTHSLHTLCSHCRCDCVCTCHSVGQASANFSLPIHILPTGKSL